MMEQMDKANETDGVMGAVVCIMNHNTAMKKKLFIKNYGFFVDVVVFIVAQVPFMKLQLANALSGHSFKTKCIK